MNFEPGDILACYGTDLTSRGISLGTSSLLGPKHLKWSPSHVGLVIRHGAFIDERLLIESTTMASRPCALLQKNISGLQSHIPFLRVKDYTTAGGTVRLLRPTRGNTLTRNESKWLTKTCVNWVESETPYDTLGAALSGTRVYQMLRSFPSANSSSLFCSEFVAYCLQSLCRMNRSNPSRYNPGRLCRELVKTGVYEISHTFEPEGINA